MRSVLKLLTDYGLDTIIIATVTTLLTGIIKLPIKKLARKANNSQSITRFITFLPVIIGFGATVLELWLAKGMVPFNDQAFYAQWLSSVSISLAIYAFWEKFLPSKSKILSEAEISDNKLLLEELKQIVDCASPTPIESKATKPIEAATAQEELAVEANSDQRPLTVAESKEDKVILMETAQEELAGEVNNNQIPLPIAESKAEKIILMGRGHVKATKES